MVREDGERRLFLGLVLGLLDPNPWRRWTAKQAAGHPFLAPVKDGGRGGHKAAAVVEGLAALPYEPADAPQAWDRRLHAMLAAQHARHQQQQQQVQVQQQVVAGADGKPLPLKQPPLPPPSSGGGGGGASASTTTTTGPPLAYLAAAALSVGRAPPSLLPRTTAEPVEASIGSTTLTPLSPILAAQQQQQQQAAAAAAAAAMDGGGTVYGVSFRSGSSMAPPPPPQHPDDALVRSAPAFHRLRIMNRRATVGSAAAAAAAGYAVPPPPLPLPQQSMLYQGAGGATTGLDASVGSVSRPAADPHLRIVAVGGRRRGRGRGRGPRRAGCWGGRGDGHELGGGGVPAGRARVVHALRGRAGARGGDGLWLRAAAAAHDDAVLPAAAERPLPPALPALPLLALGLGRRRRRRRGRGRRRRRVRGITTHPNPAPQLGVGRRGGRRRPHGHALRHALPRLAPTVPVLLRPAAAAATAAATAGGGVVGGGGGGGLLRRGDGGGWGWGAGGRAAGGNAWLPAALAPVGDARRPLRRGPGLLVALPVADDRPGKKRRKRRPACLHQAVPLGARSRIDLHRLTRSRG